jgi:hypothetical protein
VVDPSIDVLYGPNPIQKTGTVTVPRDLLREIGLDQGDGVHWALNPQLPGTLLLIPSSMIARRMSSIVEGLSEN